MPVAHDNARRAVLVANGELPAIHRLSAIAGSSSYVLAADGGANRLVQLGIVPDAVIGDFDSLTAILPASVERIAAPDQSRTDLDKAVTYLIEQGFRKISIVGATGDRLDHTFQALAILVKYAHAAELRLIDDVGTAYPVNAHLEVATSAGQLVSLMPLGRAENVLTSGLEWALHSEDLAAGVRDGTSNRATGDKVSVTISGGSLVVYVHHQ